MRGHGGRGGRKGPFERAAEKRKSGKKNMRGQQK